MQFSFVIGANNIFPLQMDVTKHQQIENAAQTVTEWISSNSNKGSKRHLHAIINNAGKGESSLFDWYTSNERLASDMDVNFYGSVFVIQHFLPLLKRQSQIIRQLDKSDNLHNVKPRIINIVSMAGLGVGVVGASMYHASKHAMEGFTGCLRIELQPFGIHVININPSFHRTNIVSDLSAKLKKSWNGLPPSRKSQYSEGEMQFYTRAPLLQE